jgi:hypothetical protein
MLAKILGPKVMKQLYGKPKFKLTKDGKIIFKVPKNEKSRPKN